MAQVVAPDSRFDCCPLCGFRYSEVWIDYVRQISKAGAVKLKAKYMGFILPCAECLPPVVIPKVYS